MSRRFRAKVAGAALQLAISACVVSACLVTAWAQQASDLSQLSLEDLTKIEVSSVARKDQQLFATPAAVFVITHDDIRRSGIRSLPELMRMVPGMQVAQLYANEWAVSSRGFNGRFADKMLVLIDGRGIYSEIYSGVYWDQNDLLLEDIDRIEVIRGPGGTLWGANAVNGIINIITLKAGDTKGALLIGEGGRLDEEGAARFGGGIGKQLKYRSYVKFLERNQLVTATGKGAGDAGSSVRVGARADWQAHPQDSVSFQGDLYRGHGDERVHVDGVNEPTSSNVNTEGGFALARWDHTFSQWDLGLQTYYNQENHAELSGNGRERTLDLDLLAHLPRYKQNEATLGVGYRLVTDRIESDPVTFNREHYRDILYSFLFEDDLVVVPRRVKVTGGFKLLNTSYTGVEIQPGLRGIWTPDERHAVWAAVSRAVRTPSVQERDLHYLRPIPNDGPILTDILAEGNADFKSEVVHAYEAGYRQALGKSLSVDIAGFYNQYKRLRSQSQLQPYLVASPTPEVVIPIVYGNLLEARSDGVEAAVSFRPVSSVRMDAAYSWINARRWLDHVSSSTTGDSWSTPTNTLSLRGTWEFARRWTFYSSLYTVTQLPDDPVDPNSHVGAYLRADAHLSFSLKENLQITAGGENLQESRHVELNPADDGYSVGSQIPRSAFVKLLWSF
ncbi:iron complex outermembrane receptor protein [Granulicella aggregans]|uniref:Iron complex outermembrane receptor protein n=1 Tax=Granulicella aggregans TaxID=474949 RepID=A0A7W7ZDP5_9BACT|nr:TonB-dependent receptor [Granulicella aggregans]MBB5058011.1 iron complex outermembrane receptor protein [Granulicella aggregans]